MNMTMNLEGALESTDEKSFLVKNPSGFLTVTGTIEPYKLYELSAMTERGGDAAYIRGPLPSTDDHQNYVKTMSKLLLDLFSHLSPYQP